MTVKQTLQVVDFAVVPGSGVEPLQPLSRGILSHLERQLNVQFIQMFSLKSTIYVIAYEAQNVQNVHRIAKKSAIFESSK